jgi:putative transposase
MASVLPSRRSIRLKDYDYSSAGMYVVTICTAGRQPLFGRVVGDAVELSAIGRIVDEEWRRTPALRSNVDLDAYVIMPNHIHGIIAINESKAGSQSKGMTDKHRTGPP